ncbi:hypothetical protein EYF80_029627 [Liparis tanakae]|uniref:Uncharacterized protein n=1 Tax=Liparis tanakae TaxID=230148 RepID=A0A4Z2H5S6_9TELE|nr:hypothetical protein EYF80_029627 [Liparis tanakae]
MSSSHLVPRKPARQVHRKPSTSSLQRPPLLQGSAGRGGKARITQAVVAVVERGRKQLSDESLAVDALRTTWTRFVDSPVDLVLTVAVDAGVAEALVDLGEAGGVLVAVRTRAGTGFQAFKSSTFRESFLPLKSRVTVCQREFVCVSAPLYAEGSSQCPNSSRSGTIMGGAGKRHRPSLGGACSPRCSPSVTLPMETPHMHRVHTSCTVTLVVSACHLRQRPRASVPARLAQALVDVGLTQPPGVAGVALAAEGGQAVDAARLRKGGVDWGKRFVQSGERGGREGGILPHST